MLGAVAMAASIAAGATAAAYGDPITDPAQAAAVQEVIRVVDAIDAAVDAKDWEAARGLFAPQVRADFSSLAGGGPATVSADELVGAWANNLKPAKTSFHLRGNHRVALRGDRATVHSHGYAFNRMEGRGDPLWEVWGTYVHELERGPQGWKVAAITFNKTHERGNPWVRDTVPER